MNDAAITLPFFKTPVFDVKFQYPAEVNPDILNKVFLSGGALTLAEIGQLIRSARLEKKERLRDMVVSHASTHPRSGEMSSISNSISTLSRLETGTVGSINLDLTLWLSHVLYEDSRLIRMYWNSPQLYEHRTALPMLPGLWINLDVDFYILSGRWLGLMYGEDTSWVNALRNEVQTMNRVCYLEILGSEDFGIYYRHNRK